MPQDAVPVDVRNITRAVGRTATRAWRRSWPDSFFRRIMGDRMPKPVLSEARDDAVNVHQLRAGHWGRSSSYLHRIGRNPTRACQQCDDLGCPAARCLVCREGPDTPEQYCWSAPAWPARGSASSATSGRTLSSCGTAGPLRPWAAATFGTKSRGLRSATSGRRKPTRGVKQQQQQQRSRQTMSPVEARTAAPGGPPSAWHSAAVTTRDAHGPLHRHGRQVQRLRRPPPGLREVLEGTNKKQEALDMLFRQTNLRIYLPSVNDTGINGHER